MKKYITPEMEITKFSAEDISVTSTTELEGGGDKDGGNDI